MHRVTVSSTIGKIDGDIFIKNIDTDAPHGSSALLRKKRFLTSLRRVEETCARGWRPKAEVGGKALQVIYKLPSIQENLPES